MNKTTKRVLTFALAAQMTVGSIMAGVAAAEPDAGLTPGTPYEAGNRYNAEVPHVIINQVYGAGLAEDAGVLVSHGFIELFNPTEQDIDLSGWSLHYADRGSNAQTGPTLGWQKLDLRGVIKAKSSYLVKGKPTGSASPKLDLSDKGDLEWDRYLNNKGLKVVLMSNQLPLDDVRDINPYQSKPEGYVDMLGTASNDKGSTIDGYETDYPTGSTEGTSKKKAVRRVEFKDSDNNKADFKQVDYETAVGAELAAISPRDGSDGDWANMPDPLVWETASLPVAYAGQPYSVTVKAVGGAAPYEYEATGLPEGLTITTEGVISGTAAATGSYAVTVTVKDSGTPASVATKELALNVQAYQAVVEDQIGISKIGEYAVGQFNADGGVAEIVKFNSDNGRFYLVNGAANPPSLDIVNLGDATGTLQKEKSVLVKELAEKNGFAFGDLTSVDINTANKRIYVAVQEADPNKKGKILALDYDGKLIAEYAAGIQPDMIKSTPDGRYVLTADEAEPRLGTEDPPGSVTIVDTKTGQSTQVYFSDPSVIDDLVHIRGAADPADGRIKSKGTKEDAYRDLEPEYIALSKDNKKAYVALQENNAIAVIDIAGKKVDAVKGLGFKDFSDAANALDLQRDGAILLENAPFQGIYMPDGIASHTINGQTYLFTANEGDATEWPGRTNASTIGAMKGSLNPDSDAYKFLNGTSKYDSVEVVSDMGHDGIYLYGGRSFSIFNADTMELVYDSGSDFETITGQRYPDFFNVSNSKITMDDRSTKKGPEPEDIKTGIVGNRVMAFIGLERVGGFMTYDVTDPHAPSFVNYTNSRVFLNESGKVNLDTDTGPEGLEFIPATISPTGLPLLLVAYEVGGKVGVYQLEVTKVTLDRKTASLMAGGASVKLAAEVLPMAEGEASVTWSSSDESVAKVDASGTVRPLRAGKAVITAISADGYGSAEAVVTVTSSGGGSTPSPEPTPEPTPEPEKPEPTPEPTPETPVFNDVNGHWAKNVIGKLAKAGILLGKPDGSFQPDQKMTRAEYAAVLNRLLGLKPDQAEAAFDDVPEQAWYSADVRSLSAAGIISGFPDGTFRPGSEITREEAFVLLYRALKDKLDSQAGSSAPYTDEADVSAWAVEAVKALTQAGVLEGNANGELNPKATITRAEIAKIVSFFVKE
ncbi:choice-of-anchor I family protein [Paenibacillus sp. NPDC057967]|uniref:choice-of-anchor I family protein n=1 Tax=Paenibacillus sp. NPDC057967 TaxID=3346293 RepID=UPI0036D8B9BE